MENNQEIEAKELEHIKTGPERLFLYVGQTTIPGGRRYWSVTTCSGTCVGYAWLGERRYVGFGFKTHRRAITVRIFDTLYHGWYFESRGDYCRLKRAKRQDTQYAATEVFNEKS
jgi:hypothetical protein